MRFLVITFLVLLGVHAFAADIPTRIHDSVSVSENTPPDVMVSHLNLVYNDSDFKAASAGIEKIASIIKAHSSTCTFSSYQINPRYRYSDNKRILDGYMANLSAPCSFTDIVEFDSVLKDISTVTSGIPAYETSVSAVRWTISDRLHNFIKDKLKIAVLTEVNTKRETYSDALDRTCYTSVITYEGAQPSADQPLLARAASTESFKSTPPDLKGEDISVTADITLICK